MKIKFYTAKQFKNTNPFLVFSGWKTSQEMKKIFMIKWFQAAFTACLVLGVLPNLNAQDNFTGDGFGGRSWYQPANFEVGHGVGTVVLDGQLHMWGTNTSNVYPLVDPVVGYSSDGTAPASNRANNKYPLPYLVTGIDDVKLISMSHAAGIIRDDNTGWVWSANSGTDLSPFGGTPMQVITDAYHVSASASHVAFVKTDGTVWSVGHNRYGAFGDGGTNTAAVTAPVQMPGMTNAVRVAAFGASTTGAIANTNLNYRSGTLILKDDGTVWAAGGGRTLVSATNNYSATQIAGLTNIVDVDAGRYHAVALDQNGDVWSWGAKYYAPHGNGETQNTTGYHYTPVQVNFPAGTPPIIAIEAGHSDITYALDEEGKLWAWGYQGSGPNFGIRELNSLTTPHISARNVADVSHYWRTASYLTRTEAYPEDARVWRTLVSGGAHSSGKAMALNCENDPTGALNDVVYNDVWGICLPEDCYGLSGAGSIGGGSSSVAVAGSLDCDATVLIGVPTVGAATELTLKIEVNVTTIGSGEFTINGGGFSTHVTPYIIETAATGVQTFYVPVKYDGSALGSVTFGIAGLGTCTADLSGITPIEVNTEIEVLPIGNLCTPITPATISK